MRKLLIISLLLLGTITSIWAQKVVACEDYDKTSGIASGIYSTWNIKSTGSYIYLLYTQDRPISKELTVYIDKKNESGDYVAHETEFISVADIGRKNWAVLDQKFTESGDYKVIFLENGKELASTTLKLDYQEGYEPSNTSNDNSNNYSNDDEIDTYYYENSGISVAQEVNATTYEVINKMETADYNYTRNKELYIVVENDKPFKTNLFYIDIELDGTFLETIEIDVEDSWDIAWTKYVFKKKGEYYIDVYNANDVYVNSFTFTVD